MIKKIALSLIGFTLLLFALFVLYGIMNPSLNHTFEIEINKSVSKVWSEMDDEANLKKWITGFKSIELIQGERNEVGSKYKMVFDENGKDLIMTQTIKEYIPNKTFAFELGDDFAQFTEKINYIPTDSVKTKLVIEQRGGGKNWFAKSMMAFMRSSIIEQQTAQYQKLKQLIESK